MTSTPTNPTPERRPGMLGTTGGRAIIAAAVLVLAIVAAALAAAFLTRPTGEALATATPSASTTPSVTPTVSAEATETASPSPTPVSAELPTGPADAVMSFTPRCDVVPPVVAPATTVLEDGRVIWRTDDGTYVVRQLTTASLEDFRAEVESSGLFAASAFYEPVRRPGTPEPPGHGACLWSFIFSDGEGEPVEVSSIMWFGDEEESTYYQPSPERETLHSLAEQVMDPTTWYGDEGWVQAEAVPFEPEEYMVIATVTVPQLATQGAPDFDDVSWPFDAPPDEFGTVFGVAQPPTRCDVADVAAIEILADELAAAGLEQFENRPISGAGAALPWAARSAAVDLSIWILLPDGRPGCASAAS